MNKIGLPERKDDWEILDLFMPSSKDLNLMMSIQYFMHTYHNYKLKQEFYEGINHNYDLIKSKAEIT